MNVMQQNNSNFAILIDLYSLLLSSQPHIDEVRVQDVTTLQTTLQDLLFHEINHTFEQLTFLLVIIFLQTDIDR